MVDFAGTIAIAGLIIFVCAAIVNSMQATLTTKLWVAGSLGLWVGIAAAASGAGWLPISRPFPVMGIFVAVPLIAAALFARTAAGSSALLSLPLPLIVALNVGRIFAFLFLVLAAQGRLSGPFPYLAAIGDIVTGLAALRMMAPARDPAHHVGTLHAWNLFGLADLVAAISLGVMSGDGSPLQVFAAPGSAAMQALPFSFVPTVLVPLWMILHAVTWVRLRRIARHGTAHPA